MQKAMAMGTASERAVSAAVEAQQLFKLVRLGRLTPREAIDWVQIRPRERAVLAHFVAGDFAGKELFAAACEFRLLVRQEFFRLLKSYLAQKGEQNGRAGASRS